MAKISCGTSTLLITLILFGGCSVGRTDRTTASPHQAEQTSNWAVQRREMVESQLRARDIFSPTVLTAMARVPRHLFVPLKERALSYNDHPLPIGYQQTISQPYIVAYMTQLLNLPEEAKVLEIGTGSGYQAAVLAEVANEVYTIEILPELAERAVSTFAQLGIGGVQVRVGDGYLGWPEQAPFDGIIVTAAPDHVPQPLIEQLAVGGKLVLPVGRGFQIMTVLTKTEGGITTSETIPVRFVPMTGRARAR